MWLFTQYGFYSVVCDKNDQDTFLVRARSRDHLDLLKSRFPKWLGKCEVAETPFSDYRFRIRVPRFDWHVVAAGLIDEVDYHNFKDRVHEREGISYYTDSLLEVWEAMLDFQEASSPRQ